MLCTSPTDHLVVQKLEYELGHCILGAVICRGVAMEHWEVACLEIFANVNAARLQSPPEMQKRGDLLVHVVATVIDYDVKFAPSRFHEVIQEVWVTLVPQEYGSSGQPLEFCPMMCTLNIILYEVEVEVWKEIPPSAIRRSWAVWLELY